MKVTDEMVERAVGRDQISPVTDGDRKHMRAVLETALADVPDTDERYELLAQDYAGAVADRRTLGARVAELESQLAAARALHEQSVALRDAVVRECSRLEQQRKDVLRLFADRSPDHDWLLDEIERTITRRY